jgi:hypothetical protein
MGSKVSSRGTAWCSASYAMPSPSYGDLAAIAAKRQTIGV